MSIFIISLRILLAAILGGLVGFEREVRGRTAGFRTHMLVCLGSALFMTTSILMSSHYSHLGAVDPSRIAAGVVTGVGFLGAGAVIRFQSFVQGLTTAASIWVVAAIGLAVGAGLYKVALIATVIVVVVLFLSRLERRLALKNKKNDSDKK